MSSNTIIKQYNQIMDYANQFDKNDKNIPISSKQSNQESFVNVLNKMTDNFEQDIKGIEHSMKELSLGNMSSEDVAMQVKAVSVEVDGVMAITKTGVDSFKQMISIQV